MEHYELPDFVFKGRAPNKNLMLAGDHRPLSEIACRHYRPEPRLNVVILSRMITHFCHFDIDNKLLMPVYFYLLICVRPDQVLSEYNFLLPVPARTL
jgi:hypothetical protein